MKDKLMGTLRHELDCTSLLGPTSRRAWREIRETDKEKTAKPLLTLSSPVMPYGIMLFICS